MDIWASNFYIDSCVLADYDDVLNIDVVTV